MIHTQTQIDNLIELAIIQRVELKKLVESLPELRTHLSVEIERNLNEIEPAMRDELQKFLSQESQAEHAKLGNVLKQKIAELSVSLEDTTAAKYSVLMAERAENETLLAKAEARIAEAASALPNAVKEIVTDELSRFPRAGEIDQLRKEFAEPKGLNPRGKWESGVTYYKLDLVAYNGDSYVANEETTQKPSRTSTKWTLNAARGAAGSGNSTTLAELTGSPANGQILIGSNGAYVNADITAGDGIAISTAAGFIEISADGGTNYQGTWDAATNNPALTSSVGTKGYYYVVNVDGSTNLNGITDWKVGDWAIYNGSVWQKVDNSESVTSVFGRVGSITAVAGDYSATQITNTAAGSITATNVQDAINELDGEKLAKASNLSDVASVTTSRTNLGVTATGADTTYAYRANNLNDLASVTSARTNLGLGSAAVESATFFLQSANSLSDVASVALARTNLGLGNSATRDVGTTAGTVAAGDDARFTDSRTPTGPAGGDLTGTYPNPSLTISGVSAGGYGSASSAVVITLDSKGRATSASAVNIQIAESQVTNLVTDLASKIPSTEKGANSGVATLDSGGKIPLTQLPDSILGQVTYMGTWNAATNSPTLANPPATTTLGDYYIVTTGGTFASISFAVGDWIISNGADGWAKVDNTDAVASVFGRTGNVTATNGDYTASNITNVPAGNIVATEVQAAINELDGDKLAKASNLSDLVSPSTARTNLGLGSAATQNDTYFLQVANNLSDLASVTTARSNLGLGTMAVQNAASVSITGGSITGITDLAVADGGTGVSTTPANGQLLIGNGTGYTVANLTAGTGVTITNSSGGISIATTGAQTAQTITAEVVNAESTTITKGQVVYAFGSTGNRMSVKLAYNTSDATSAKTLGIVSDASIAANGTGMITLVGVVDGLTLGSYTEGDQLYLGATAGSLTSTKPYAPNHLVYVGIVERANNGNGELYVRVQNGYELNEIHDVQITTPPSSGALLVYDATNALWKAARLTAGTNIAITNADASVTVGITGVIAGTYGGTGVNNGANTITIAGNVTHAGAFTQTFTATANTSLTLPTTGTLATLAGSEALSNKTITASAFNGTVGATTASTGAFTTLSATGDVTLTATSNLIANKSVLLSDGTAGTATGAIYFINDTDTGFYRAGGNTLGFMGNGASLGTWSPTGLAVTGTLSATGNITLPFSGASVQVGTSLGYGSFMNSSGRTGLVAYGQTNGSFPDQFDLYAANSVVARGSSTGLAVTGALSASGNLTLSAANPSLIGGTNAGSVSVQNPDAASYITIYGSAHATKANKIEVVAGSTLAGSFSSTGLAVTGALSATGNILGSGTYVGISNPTYPLTQSNGIGAAFRSFAGTDIYGVDFRRWTGTGTEHSVAYIGQYPNGAGGFSVGIYYDAAKTSNTQATTRIVSIDQSGLAVTGALSATSGLGLSNGNSLSFGGAGSDTYISGSAATDYIEFVTGAAQRALLNNTGLAITGALTVASSGNTESSVTSSAGTPAFTLIPSGSGIQPIIAYKTSSGAALRFGTVTGAGLAGFASQMVLDATGLGIGTTSPVNSLHVITASGQYVARLGVNGTGSQNFINFVIGENSTPTGVGSVTYNGSNTLFNSTSDYRLKEITGPLTDSGTFIDALKPKVGAWKSNGSKFVGFIAHEFAEVSPSSVTGEKDAVDSDGKPIYQAMQASSAEVIANLVAELQSLRQRVAALENS